MHSPGVGPTNQPGSPLYPATFRNMAPYEDAYLDQDMAYPILEPPPHDPFVETANMLPEIVPLSEQVSDDSSPLSDHAASADGCNGEDSDDTSPFAKLPTPAEVLADKDNKGSSAGDVGIMAKAVQRDIKEPQRPLSAYALYFRDTQASIKLQNPHASFAEVSQIVASMWKGLEPEHKLVYKRKTKVAKMEYRRAIAEHRSRLSMNSAADQLDISRRSGYMSSPPGAMSTPPRDSMSPLQNSNPLLSSAMDDGSPRDYMDVASPEDVLSTQQQQQRQQPPMALNSLSMFQKPKQASVIPTDCCPQQMGMNSLRASAPCCASDRKPERSPSLCNQTSGCGAGMPNNQWRIPVITFTRCRRSGCPNPPVPSHEWDVEYCSSECVILHCKNVFSGWAAQRQIADRLLPQ